MPLYPYKCPCGTVTDELRSMSMPTPSAITCPSCGGKSRRVWTTPYVAPVMHEHWNNSVGKPISSRRQFQDALKQASEKQTERTGIYSNYVEADPTDTKALGVTEEGLASQAKRRRDTHGYKEKRRVN